MVKKYLFILLLFGYLVLRIYDMLVFVGMWNLMICGCYFWWYLLVYIVFIFGVLDILLIGCLIKFFGNFFVLLSGVW